MGFLGRTVAAHAFNPTTLGETGQAEFQASLGYGTCSRTSQGYKESSCSGEQKKEKEKEEKKNKKITIGI